MKEIESLRGIDLLDDNLKIARYFSGSKLSKLLETNQIWYCNSEIFSDKRERTIPKSFFTGWSKNNKQGYEKIHNLKSQKIGAYISCWTKFNSENYALWKIYDDNNDGVCIVTTVGKFKSAINRKDMFMCEVEYIGVSSEKRIDLPWINYKYDDKPYYGVMRCTEKYKILPYAYEQEIRSIIYDKNDKEGFLINVNLKNIIDEVYISPFSDKEQLMQTKEMLTKVFDSSIIKYSEIIE